MNVFSVGRSDVRIVVISVLCVMFCVLVSVVRLVYGWVICVLWFVGMCMLMFRLIIVCVGLVNLLLFFISRLLSLWFLIIRLLGYFSVILVMFCVCSVLVIVMLVIRFRFFSCDRLLVKLCSIDRYICVVKGEVYLWLCCLWFLVWCLVKSMVVLCVGVL